MVSVIVPVYNVEKYLRRCLDSLKAQRLADVEFIVIDDGSTDCSGAICDEYASDERFRVIHQENRGLSAARNRGLDEARGEWIEFVDSDDWVESGFCEIPLKAAIENNADLVIFQEIRATQRGIIRKQKKREIPIGIITHEQAIDFGSVHAWNKLYKRTLFSSIKYPEGHVYEDIATTYKLVYRASHILMLGDKLYYHRKREGSITQRRTVSSEKDRLTSRIQRYQDLIRLGYPEYKEKERLQMDALKYCIRIEPVDDVLYKRAESILSEIGKMPVSWEWIGQTLLWLWKSNKDLFNFICKIAGKRIEDNIKGSER